MNSFLRVFLIVLVSVQARTASAAPPVVPGSLDSPTAEYQAVATAAGISWGNRTANEPVQHVLLRLDYDRDTLTVELPTRVSRTTAETWLQDLVDRMGWSDVRLYSNQNASQINVAARVRKQNSFSSPFRRRTNLDVALLRARLQTLTPNRMLICVRTLGATVTAVEPPPAARVTRNDETFLFYNNWSQTSPTLTVTYGLTPRQIAALVSSLALWLLFPSVVLRVYRSHLLQQPEMTDERRQRIYASWQRGVRIAGVAGASLTFAVLTYSRVVPRFLGTGMLPVVPLWYWYGAMCKLISLPESAEENCPTQPRIPLLSVAGDLSIAGLSAVFFLAPALMAPQALFRTLPIAPLVIGGGGALVWVASGVMYYRVKRQIGIAAAPAVLAPAIPHDPAAVRELLQRLTAEIAAEELLPPPAFPNSTPALAANYALAMYATMQALDVDQRAALKATNQLAMGGDPVRTQSLWGLVWCGAPLAIGGIAAWFINGWGRWFVVLGGMALAAVLMGINGLHTGRSLKALRQRMEDGDVRVAQAMDDPARLLAALGQLAECERLHGVKSSTGARLTSMYEERRRRLARRLGWD